MPVHALELPSQSSNLNSVENLRESLDSKVRKCGKTPKTKGERLEALRDDLKNLDL